MDKIEHDETMNELEVEISDLDPIDEGGRFAALQLTAHRLFTKIHWEQLRPATLRIVLLCGILLIPLAMNTSYRVPMKNNITQECVRQQPKVVYVSSEVGTPVTTSNVTITIITITAQSATNLQQGYVIAGTFQISSSTCK